MSPQPILLEGIDLMEKPYDARSLLLSRRSLVKLGAGLGMTAAFGGLLAACGGDDDDDSSSTNTASEAATEDSPDEATQQSTEAGGSGSTTTEEAATTEAETPGETAESTETEAEDGPVSGGRLVVGLTGEPPNLDVHLTTDAIVGLVMYHVYETLFTWDAEFATIPLLAAAHEISDDGLTHTVTLREGVTFHNGEAMEAKDVIASIERWGRIVGLGEGMLAVTDSITEVDASTIEFKLVSMFGTFEVALARAVQGCGIYPKSIIDASDDTSLAEFIGTGPYKFVEWLPDRHILMERYDDYAAIEGEPEGYGGNKAAYLDEIEFRPVPTEAARVAGLQAGDLHYVENISSDQYPVLKDDAAVTVEILPPDSWLNFPINLNSPLTKDHNIRKAIQLALDPEPIMLAAFGEGFYELTPTLLPGADIWYSDAGSEIYNHPDPEQAKAILEEAGYDGTPVRLMTQDEVQLEYNASVVIKQQLEAVGFTVDLQVYDGATLSDRRNDETLWEIYSAWASFRPDPVMRNLTCSATGWWCNEEKDELIAQLQAESDYEIRFPLWEQIQQKFYEDVPRLKFGDSKRMLVKSPKLHGISASTNLQPEFSNAWLEE